MATLAVWKRTRKSTTGPRERCSAVVFRPGSPERDFTPPDHVRRQPARRTSTTALMLGRAIFGGYFLYNGLRHFKNADAMGGYAASKGIPMPKAAVIGSGALIALGGLSLLAGFRPKAGASMIGAFLLGVTPAMHDFWRQQDPQAKMNEEINFSKNVALLGGAALAAAVAGPWPASLGNH